MFSWKIYESFQLPRNFAVETSALRKLSMQTCFPFPCFLT
eukprot:UN20710